MPKRFAKAVALYYPDARIRKQYCNHIGVSMGEGTFANLGMKVTNKNDAINVYIGKNVSIAPNVTFIADSCANNGKEINNLSYVQDKLTCNKNITVEDEAWIGANVTIMPGVNIGRCSVIGAGSLVLSDVEPYSVYVGSPAKKVRDLKTGERCK
jgi:maltose O-acetyltransferase